MRVEPLLGLAATVTAEQGTQKVLNAIVSGLAKEPGVALARIWLLAPGDICNECFLRAECQDQSQCLHLAASAGTPLNPGEDWSFLQGHFRRIPLAGPKVGAIGKTGKSIFVRDVIADNQWILRPTWASAEKISSFVGHPLIFRDKVFGVLGVFSRDPLEQQDFVWLRIFADQAAAVLANARAFEDLARAQSAEEEHARELKQVIDLAPMHMFIWEADGNASYGNRTSLDYFGPIPLMHPKDFLALVTHPEDVEKLTEGILRARGRGEPFAMEARMRRHDGVFRWFQYRLIPLRDEAGRIIRWCGTRIDIDDRKRAADQTEKKFLALQEHFDQLQQVMDAVPQHMFTIYPDGSHASSNRTCRNYFDSYEALGPREFISKFAHPDDQENMWAGFLRARGTGRAFSVETRLRGRDGQYHWFLEQLVPIHDATGQIVRWCGVRTDIDDQKRNQDRTQRENLALREEVDKTSMFEEIVGASPALHTVLARVAKVAPSDSTVLITGETGTGKELIARAIHRRSPRASRAFVSVNCAAIPRDLIASELFGHEKGAFTGALQRRLGRFELAEGGTIFLDEIGELTPEIQVALLRVLQEREFDRVGGSGPVRADVRVIAATHRDLPASVDAGTFRSDLYYRINVFPVEVPPLRERKEDIHLLVEYFIHRYASRAGKRITRIDKQSLARLQFYSWPGNIRELQNIIERSVILCESDEFSVDESWLSLRPSAIQPLQEDLAGKEKERIEAALAEAKGRVSGPTGAAVKLGIPASTLDSKIKSLKIDKRRFQSA